MNKVAILVATYNGEKYLDEQLSSIASQINADIHIIVRDDGSSDGTLRILNEYQAKCNLSILSDATPTGSPATNFIKILKDVDLSDYDYVAFSDQDDIWFPSKISRAIDILNLNKADAYSSDLIAFDSERQLSWVVKKGSNLKTYDYLFQGASAGCTYVLSRLAINEVCTALFNENKSDLAYFSHDWLIYAICRSRGLKWTNDDFASIAYRQHSSNSFGAMPGYGGLWKRLKLSKSGWYRKQIIVISQFLVGSNGEARVIDAVKRYSLADRIYLARSSYQFRRRTRDAVLLSLILLFGFF